MNESDITWNTTWLHDLAPETVVAHDKRIKAVRGTRGRAMVFAQGSDNVLRLIRENDQDHSGWDQIAVSPAREAVRTFDVWQEPDSERCRIAVVLACEKDSADIIRLSRWIDDPAMICGADLWQGATQLDAKLSVHRLVLGRDHLLWGGADGGADVRYFFHDGERMEGFELPEHGIKLLDLALGFQDGFPGVFSLYETRTGCTLFFESFPIARFGGTTHKVRFQCGDGPIRAMALLSSGNQSILFAGGDRLHGFVSGPDGHLPVLSISFRDNETINQLAVSQDGEHKTLVVGIESAGQWQTLLEMFYYRQEGEPARWTLPTPIGHFLANITLMRGEKGFFNQKLFGVGRNDSLICYSRTARHMIWKREEVALRDTGGLHEFISCNTVISFKGAETLPESATFRLWSSRPVRIKVDGDIYFCSSEQPVTLQVRPFLVLLCAAEPLMGILFLIEADFLDKPVIMDMAAPLVEKLASMQTVEMFRQDKVFGKHFSERTKALTQHNLESMVQCVHALLAIRRRIFQQMEVTVTGATSKTPVTIDTSTPKVLESATAFTTRVAIHGVAGAAVGAVVGAGVAVGMGTTMAAIAGIAKVGAITAAAGAATGPIGWIIAGGAIAGATLAIASVLLNSIDTPDSDGVTLRFSFNHQAQDWQVHFSDAHSGFIQPLRTPDEALAFLEILLREMGIDIPLLQQWITRSIPFERIAKFTRILEEEWDQGMEDMTSGYGLCKKQMAQGMDTVALAKIVSDRKTTTFPELRHTLPALINPESKQPSQQQQIRRNGTCQSFACQVEPLWLTHRLNWYARKPLMDKVSKCPAMAAIFRLAPPGVRTLEQLCIYDRSACDAWDRFVHGQTTLEDFIRTIFHGPLVQHIISNPHFMESLDTILKKESWDVFNQEQTDISFLAPLYKQKLAPLFPEKTPLTLARTFLLTMASNVISPAV